MTKTFNTSEARKICSSSSKASVSEHRYHLLAACDYIDSLTAEPERCPFDPHAPGRYLSAIKELISISEAYKRLTADGEFERAAEATGDLCADCDDPPREDS